jgi:hypothetical protein
MTRAQPGGLPVLITPSMIATRRGVFPGTDKHSYTGCFIAVSAAIR